MYSYEVIAKLNNTIKHNETDLNIKSTGTALTYFTVSKSYALTLLTYGCITGIGSGMAYLTPLEVAMKVNLKAKNMQFFFITIIFFLFFLK